MKASDEELARMLAELHASAEQTREQLRAVARSTEANSLTMSNSQLATLDGMLGKLTVVERKRKAVPAAERNPS